MTDRPFELTQLDAWNPAERDEAILQFLPALRKALGENGAVVNAERLQSFAAFAARLLGKPAFDREEREPRLRVAGDLAEALAQVPNEPDSAGRLARLLTGPGFRSADMTPARQREWFADWLGSGDADLRAALTFVADAGRGELERFDAFAEAYARAVDEGRIEADAAAATGVGSLLIFATEPKRLPLVFERPLRALAELLGAEAVPAGTPASGTGASSVRARVERQIPGGRCPRARHARRPEPDGAGRTRGGLLGGCRRRGPGHRPHAPADVYLSACAIYRDEAAYLARVDRVPPPRRASSASTSTTTAAATTTARCSRPTSRAASCGLHDWPMEGRGAAHRPTSTASASTARSRAGSRFLDLDEFLFSPTEQSRGEILPEYERWPAVGVNWAVFGPSGHEQKPPGLVIENYDRRLAAGAHTIATRTIKSIVDPARVAEVTGVHAFRYDRLGTVDENHYPIYGGRTKSVSFERLRVNHYLTKSLEEYRLRAARARPDPAMIERSFDVARKSAWDEDSEHDEAIMRFLPALRRALSTPPQS